jgi:hypothetical protein
VTAQAIEQPCLFIEYTGDTIVFPSDADAVFSAIGSHDKTRYRFAGDHHGQALNEGDTPGRTLAGQTIRHWLAERFSL